MAKYCECCGKTNSYISGAPLLLLNNKMLCGKCGASISKELTKLHRASSRQEFDSLAEKIMSIATDQYNETALGALDEYIKEKKSRANLPDDPSFRKEPEKEGLHEKLQKRKQLLSNYMMTTGYEFEGYKITKYLTVISGQVVLGTGFLSEITASVADFFGDESILFGKKLEAAKNAATERLIDRSIELGGNAIIGVDFDYITLRNNMLGVIANGTSVVIEKTE